MNEEFKTPGQLITHLVEQRGWSKRVLATVLNMSETVVNKITTDVRAISAADAIALEEVFGEPADTFIKLQSDFDLAKARITTRPDPTRSTRAQLFGELPISAMIKRGWLNVDNIKDYKTVESQVASFFGVEDAANIPALSHSAKKTHAEQETTSIQLAWLYRVRQIALETIAPPASQKSIETAIAEIEPLRISEASIRKVPQILAKAGIRFIIVESLPSAKIDGVCFWLGDDAPVIAMTLRFDRIDNFWFVLRHELEHARLGHGKKTINIDSDLQNDSDLINEEENAANSAASEFCVPAKKMNSFIARKSPFFKERDVVAFSRINQVHPGLVVGQIHRQTGKYDIFRKHLVKIRQHIIPSAIVDGWGDTYPLGE